MRGSITSAVARRRLCRSLTLAFFAAAAAVSGQNLSPTPISQRDGAPDAERLERGKPIQRDLAGSQAHDYRVTLKAGQFLDLLVQKKGIDVTVTVSGPDGMKLSESETPNG